MMPERLRRSPEKDEMIYNYECDGCGAVESIQQSIKFSPPESLHCWDCDTTMARIWEVPFIHCDTDPDYVPPESRVSGGDGHSKAQARKIEDAYQKDIQNKRSERREFGKNKGGQLSRSVPAHLYHGKIKQTGDKNYWKDPANLKKHKSTEI